MAAAKGARGCDGRSSGWAAWHATRCCARHSWDANPPCICTCSTRIHITITTARTTPPLLPLCSRAAFISLVASPSLRCVRATARLVMWPCTSVDSSSLRHWLWVHERQLTSCDDRAGRRTSASEQRRRQAAGGGSSKQAAARSNRRTFWPARSPRSFHRSPRPHRVAGARTAHGKSSTAGGRRSGGWHCNRSRLRGKLEAAAAPPPRPHLELIVFGQAEQVAALHLQQILYGGLSDAHHGAGGCVRASGAVGRGAGRGRGLGGAERL